MNAKAAFAALTAVGLFSLLAVALVSEVVPTPGTPAGPPWIGEALWSTRALDLAVQAFIVLAGVLAIVLLLREEPEGARHG